jgi:hypothetical protein
MLQFLKDLLRWLHRVLDVYEKEQKQQQLQQLEFTVKYRDFVITYQGGSTMKLTDIEKVALSVQPMSAAGNPAPVETAMWTCSDDTVLTVVPGADGLSCEVITTGKIGTARVSVTVDADMGEGVISLEGFADFEVVASQAVSLAVNVGTPEVRV